MATHSSVLAWRIPGTGEPGGLPSMGSHRVRHDWSDLAAAAAGGNTLCKSYGYGNERDTAPGLEVFKNHLYIYIYIYIYGSFQMSLKHTHSSSLMHSMTNNQKKRSTTVKSIRKSILILPWLLGLWKQIWWGIWRVARVTRMSKQAPKRHQGASEDRICWQCRHCPLPLTCAPLGAVSHLSVKIRATFSCSEYMLIPSK